MSADRPIMLARAAEMRRRPTEAERRLWNHLRASQLAKYKFRRQATIDGRIVDFFCPQRGLVVEIDGDTHDVIEDALRDRDMLHTQRFATVRYTNRDIMENIEGVLQHLLAKLDDLSDRWAGNTTPDPSSEEEGRKSRHDQT